MTASERYEAALKAVREARLEWEADLMAGVTIVQASPPPRRRGRKISRKPNLRLIIGGQA